MSVQRAQIAPKFAIGVKHRLITDIDTIVIQRVGGEVINDLEKLSTRDLQRILQALS